MLRTALDTRVHGRHDVETIAEGIPILGGIAFILVVLRCMRTRGGAAG